MSTREELIISALGLRLDAARERLLKLEPERFADFSGYVAQLRQSLAASALGLTMAQPPEIVWIESGNDCLSSIRALSLGEDLKLTTAANLPAPAEDFLSSLEKCKRDSERRLRLLTERYSCVLNFNAPSENDIREHVLMRLMAPDRATVEQQSVTALDADDLLLKLNLIAIQAPVTPDLRFIDALNYYYELLPADWVPRARHAWLIASFLGLYARALAVLTSRNQTIAHRHTREQPARSAADL